MGQRLAGPVDKVGKCGGLVPEGVLFEDVGCLGHREKLVPIVAVDVGISLKFCWQHQQQRASSAWFWLEEQRQSLPVGQANHLPVDWKDSDPLMQDHQPVGLESQPWSPVPGGQLGQRQSARRQPESCWKLESCRDQKLETWW